MAQLTYPGVYIEEFEPGSPIVGVGTSTAAFLGSTNRGTTQPTKLTSWEAFLAAFTLPGVQPKADSYLWYAVRGFFENGGKVCYIARVTNETFASVDLMDGGPSGGKPTLVIRGRQPGPLPNMKVDVGAASSVSNRSLFRPTAAGAAVAGSAITAATEDDAGQFLPGDHLVWNGIGAAEPKVIVKRISGKEIQLEHAVVAAPGGTVTVRLADLRPADGSDTFLLSDDSKLWPGSIVALKQTGVTDDPGVIRTIVPQQMASGTKYRVTLRSPVKRVFDMSSDIKITSSEFSLTVKEASTTVGGPYDEVSLDPEHPRYAPAVIAADASSVVDAFPADPPSTQTVPKNLPKVATNQAIAGGQFDDPTTLGPSDYAAALRRLAAIDDVNLVAAPGQTGAAIQSALIAHCELLMDRFAILDSRRGAPLSGTGSVDEQRNALTSARGYGALYYPWLIVPAAVGNAQVLVPPSGHVAGIYARVDERRGVHKSPAGEEATVNGAVGVETLMSDIDHGQLNLDDVNVIRVFRPGGRPVVWGARTLASLSIWQYVAVRRLFEFLEESIQEGINWAVFEPNNEQLWKKLHRTITAFLTGVWRDGALFGDTPEEAFYVRIDEVLNPVASRELGELHIEIGCQPAYPAEFIVVRIGIWEGGSEITEP